MPSERMSLPRFVSAAGPLSFTPMRLESGVTAYSPEKNVRNPSGVKASSCGPGTARSSGMT